MEYRITAFIIAEAVRPKRGKEVPAAPPAKSAPHYFEKSVPAQYILGQDKKKIGTREVFLLAKTYPPEAILVEGSVEVENVFGDGVLELKDQVHDACYEFAKKYGGKDEPSEEYTVYQISGYRGDPEQFILGNEAAATSLLKSEKLELDEQEVEHTLAHQLKYAKDDLAIVDWDGALLFDPQGELEETVELLELANYQLLRYRILDEDLDERMFQISKLAQMTPQRKWFWIPSREVTEEFRDLIRLRSQSVTQFENLEKEIKLIGDWYSARLYDLLSKKFRLEEWRSRIREKLESLEDVYAIAGENLGMSRVQRLELIQIWGFFILQIGWLALIILEFLYFTR